MQRIESNRMGQEKRKLGEVGRCCSLKKGGPFKVWSTHMMTIRVDKHFRFGLFDKFNAPWQAYRERFESDNINHAHK